VREADWAEAWKSHFPVLRVGRRLVIRPTWRRHRRLPGDVVLSLDPGMAFGTGLHPTTRLCLAALETLADEGWLGSGRGAGPGAGAGGAGASGRGLGPAGNARVLDVGCGSGILAIAAGKLGARDLLGVDTDPIAVESTLANARLNGLTRRIRVRQGSVPTGEPAFDVVLANLIASLLVQLAPDLSPRARARRPNPGLGHLPRPRNRCRGRLPRRRTHDGPPVGRRRLGRPRGNRAGALSGAGSGSPSVGAPRRRGTIWP